MKRMVLVGNPNCGKTTLFNGLTGSQQRVGNWPGVTVEKKSGSYVDAGETYTVLDLPGVYALSMPEHAPAKDAQITAEVIAAGEMDVIVNVVDACHLERHLYLTSQLLELGKPMVIALNMSDIATQQGIRIDIAALSQQLQCPVVVLQAHRQIGLEELRRWIRSPLLPVSSPLNQHLPQDVANYFVTQQDRLSSTYAAYRWMEHPEHPHAIDDLEMIIADARYQMIHAWVLAVQTKRSDAPEDRTARLDRIVLNRFLGLPIFFALMYLVFFLAIGVGGAFQSGFDILSKALFIQAPEYLLTQINAPTWLNTILTHGVGQALNTIVTFMPVLAVMYFLMAYLESSGYMARAAFVVDRMMRALGLPGQAFVPMIVGFGCNVPAIMAARSLHTERDRYVTVLMNPYMSCSARLAIYAVFVAAFFPSNGYRVIFSLYLLGIMMAMLTGYLLRHTLLQGKPTPMILELPAYHRPSMRRLCREASVRLRYFLTRAGRVILPLCVGLSVLSGWTVGSQQSILALLGQVLTPLFAPMGISADNWPAVVSLITGMLAKEVVIGTLNSLYFQMQHASTLVSVDIWQACQQAVFSVYEHLRVLVSTPSASQAATPLSGMLLERFGSATAAYAYLLFVLLYIPCVSTMAAIFQEANQRLMWFSIAWSLLLAYGVAVIFYQITNWTPYAPQILLLGAVFLVSMIGLSKSWGHRDFGAS